MITISQDEFDVLLRNVVVAFTKMMQAKEDYKSMPLECDNVGSFASVVEYNDWKREFDSAKARRDDARQRFKDYRKEFFDAGTELSHYIPILKWFKYKDMAIALFHLNSGYYPIVAEGWEKISRMTITGDMVKKVERSWEI